jgi:hypothetical protein
MNTERHSTSLPLRSVLLGFAGLALAGVILAGCDSAGTSSQGGNVAVGFGTVSSSADARAFAKADDSLTVDGANGALTITDIRFIVSEVEMEGEADSAEFETEEPAFVDLPLNSTDVVSVVSGQIPPGTYNEFEFEVEDADLDDDEEDDEISRLRQNIEDAGFSDWPSAASMVVVGTFTPDGGDARMFTTYFDAEIEAEIEMEDRSFVVRGDDPSRQLTVNLSPSRWFVSDGQPLDLSSDEYQNPEEPVEFEVEFEEESKIEFDD